MIGNKKRSFLIDMIARNNVLIGPYTFYIVNRFLLWTYFLNTQQSTYTFHRSLQSKCIETCLLLSLIYTTLYQCRIHLPTYLPPHAQTLTIETMIVIRWLLLFVYYLIALDNTDISISNKGKMPISTNGVKAYSKETLSDKIRRLTTTNI